MMNDPCANKNAGFSLIEVIIVVVILGIITGIALPKFAHAGSGRRLSAAKKTLIADMNMAMVRSRAKSVTHVIKFYPTENMYVINEGLVISRENVVIARDFDLEPYEINISRTNLIKDNSAIISVYGQVSPGFTVGLKDDGAEIAVVFGGVADLGLSVSESITVQDIQAEVGRSN